MITWEIIGHFIMKRMRYGEKAFEPLDPPVKEGVNFMGWYLND